MVGKCICCVFEALPIMTLSKQLTYNMSHSLIYTPSLARFLIFHLQRDSTQRPRFIMNLLLQKSFSQFIDKLFLKWVYMYWIIKRSFLIFILCFKWFVIFFLKHGILYLQRIIVWMKKITYAPHVVVYFVFVNLSNKNYIIF